MAKVSCILRHRGVQLILTYSLARLVILVAGKVRGLAGWGWGGGGGIISSVSSFSFLLLFLPCPSTISSIFSLHFYERRHKMTYKGGLPSR